MLLRSACSLALAGALLLSGAAMAACSPASTATVDAPGANGQVPLFPGLTLVSEEPASGGGLTDGSRSLPLIEGRKRTYTTTATIEEVYAFYQQQLGGKTSWGSETEHTEIGPNGVAAVMRTRYAYDFQDSENLDTGQLIPGASQRALLQRNRPPSSDGDWIQEGGFTWVAKDARGAPTRFHVAILDASVALFWSGYSPKTEVTVFVSRYGPVAD